MVLTILFLCIGTLTFCEENFTYRGKKYDQKDYCYNLPGSKLVLYKYVSMSIIPEYIKEIEVEIAGNKREEVLAFLERYYTEKPEWADAVKTEDGSGRMSLIMKAADVLCIAVIIVLLIVLSYRGYIINEWEMIAADDGIEITAYNGNKTDIIIPSKVDGLDIVGIKDFSNTSIRKKDKVKSVDIPDTVKRISGNSFNDYHYLEQVTFTTSVSSVTGSSFQGCPSLSTFVIQGTQFSLLHPKQEIQPVYLSNLNRSNLCISAPALTAPSDASDNRISVFHPLRGPALTTTIFFPIVLPLPFLLYYAYQKA